ncbi:SDR family oxidoreductase [Catenovulum adriaticum]|uniref:SDR family oxidoreductase n=1 Tax=Catenovulum adriaticum TaxID=2984846 RepID=A0ABY7APB5_9ALTE|nr:SDR family oxidoreductase [Catenovulum sp. TS8]WAJ71405.1 SDR family oxidoreductase [Catenovulum sp. TS8]
MTQHILITGASSGIGRELAIQANQLGYRLSLCARDSTKMAVTLNKLTQSTPVFSDCFCVSDEAASLAFVKQAEHNNGKVDVLINCAGLNNARGMGHEVALEKLDWMMQINCYAPIRFMQAVLPKMQQAGSGCIINILSTVCLHANPGIAAYTASKTALDGYFKVMRKELKKEGIKCLSVYPGGVDTQFREADRPLYLTAESVAKATLQLLNTDTNTHIHELVMRPSIEDNF